MDSSNQKIKITTNADDFGICEQRNSGILELYLKGKLTEVSFMVNMDFTKEAADLIRTHKINAGLHLNLTEGLPTKVLENGE